MRLQNELTDLQPLILELFIKSIRENRLSHGYLFEGSRGVGKKRMVLWLAQSLFCTNQTEVSLACDNCAHCTRIKKGYYPDVHWLKPDGASIKIDQIREIKNELGKYGMESERKILIVDEAEKMTTQSANSLLKFIEEPEDGMLIIFITDNAARLLPTLKSRLQRIVFKELSFNQLIERFTKAGIAAPKARLYACLTSNEKQAVVWDTDEGFNKARDLAIKLYQSLHQHNGTNPLILIQDEWLSLFKEKALTSLSLDMLLLIYRDRLHLTLFEVYNPIYTTQKEWLLEDAKKFPLVETTRQINLILEAKSKLDSNMNTQLLMEELVLKIQKGGIIC